MKTLQVPNKVAVSVSTLSRVTRRECELVRKKYGAGLNAEEQAELAAIYAEVPAECTSLTPQQVDIMAEEYAESRRNQYHDRPLARNFHE